MTAGTTGAAGAAPGTAAVPELSVVIPAYDAVETLDTQLEALLAQRPAWPWEVVVADNGSTDGTADLVREWAATRMPELRLVDASARRGPSAARNLGVAAARAPRIAFCDADDRVGDGWVATVRRALDVHEFVAGPFEGSLLNGGAGSAVSWTAQATALTVKPFLPQFVTAGSGNMGVLRSVFEEVGGFDEGARTAEDDDFCLRVQLSGHQLVFVPELVLHVRRRDGFWDVCRQAYAYGAGEKRLLHRYAEFAQPAARPGGPGAGSSQGAQQAPARAGTRPSLPARAAAALGRAGTRAGRVATRLGRVASKAVTVRRLGDLADVGWRVSWSLGWRLTRVDPALPRVSRSDPRTLRADASR
jgi:hypothetical protein